VVSGEDIITLVFYVIIISFSIILINVVTGKYLDLKFERNDYLEQGKGINLLHVIATSSELLIKDRYNQPMKTVFDKQKIIDASNENKELECCNYYDYNYYLEIDDFRSGESWIIGPQNDLYEFFRKGKTCETISKDKALSTYSIPITIFDGINTNPGTMKLRLIETPLSNIAYHTEVACMKDNYEFQFDVYNLKPSGIRLTQKDSDKYEICVLLENDNEICKTIECDIAVVKEHFPTEECDEDCKNYGCYPVKIIREDEKVVIYVPQIF
jgi:hypothetical protein